MALTATSEIDIEAPGGDAAELTAALGDLIGLQRVTDTSEFSYRFGVEFSTLDATVHGSWVFDGTSSYPNKLGVNTTKPVEEPVTGARANDTGYVAGAADVAAVIAGYDNVNNALAGLIASQHSMLYSGADHSAIFGGSLNTVGLTAVYAGVLLGTSNTVETDCDYAFIIGGDQNKIVTGANDTIRGFRGAILGATESEVRARNGIILGGSTAVVAVGGTYGTIINGVIVTASGDHALAGGNTVTVSGAYSIGWGDTVTVAAARSFAVGDNHTIASGHDFSSALGTGGVTPFSGAHVFASRNRGGTAGFNLALDFQCSHETTDTTTTRLSLAGASTYPVQPADSIVSGFAEVTGVDSAGVCSAFHIDFVSERIGTGTPTLRQNATVVKYDGLALPTDPTMNATTGGIYRVQVVGIAATNIRWNARIVATQTVFT